jgi:P27 family predicted phage terminase small subunit
MARMKGRKPNPLTLLRGANSPGNRKKYAHRVAPLTDVPAHLGDSEKLIFEEVMRAAPAGQFGQIDAVLLGCLATSANLYRRMCRELDAVESFTVKTTSTRRAHPLLTAINEQVKVLLALSDALALNPTSRQRLKIPEMPGDWSDAG